MARKKLVRTPEGFVVDPETGEVVDVDNIDYSHPEYRVFSFEDLERKEHYAPLYAPRDPLLDIGELPHALSSAKNRDREGEEKAFEIGGVKGLSIFKCLKNMGCDAYTALYAIEKAFAGSSDGKWVELAKQLSRTVDEAVENALVKWIVYPSRPIEVSKLPGEKRMTRYGLATIIDVGSAKVQVMRRKIDVSGRIGRIDLKKVLERLTEMLNVSLSLPRPAVATIVMKLPFTVNLGAAAILGIRQKHRVKIVRSFYTALVFRNVANIYAKLCGSLDRARYAALDILPILCLCSSSS